MESNARSVGHHYVYYTVCKFRCILDAVILKLFIRHPETLSHSDLATYVVTILLSALEFASLFWQHTNQKVVLTQTGLNIPVIM